MYISDVPSICFGRAFTNIGRITGRSRDVRASFSILSQRVVREKTPGPSCPRIPAGGGHAGLAINKLCVAVAGEARYLMCEIQGVREKEEEPFKVSSPILLLLLYNSHT